MQTRELPVGRLQLGADELEHELICRRELRLELARPRLELARPRHGGRLRRRVSLPRVRCPELLRRRFERSARDGALALKERDLDRPSCTR